MRQSILLSTILTCIALGSNNAFLISFQRRPTTSYTNRQDVVSSLSAIRAPNPFNNTVNDSTTNKPPVKLRKTQLKNDLKDYRQQQAGPLKKPPYTVFTNAALDDIYARLPTTKEELLEVKGIGPKKLELYGDDILNIVAPYTNRGPTNNQAFPSPVRKVMSRPTRISIQSLTKEQKQAAKFLLQPSRPNGFVTGSAGTGKSYVLKYLVQELQKKKKVGVCAPTGIAAIHVGGSTLHSFFGIGLGTGSLSSILKKVQKNTEAQKRIDETDVLIIDECSMLSSDLLETLDTVVRYCRKEGSMSDLPFGGMQVICFGDFFQLPPIVKGEYDGVKPFCFLSSVWEELGLTENMMELQEVQRQEANEFVDLLNKVRVGDIGQQDIQQLNERCVVGDHHPLPTDGIVPTRLYSLNRDVDGENEARLQELEGKEVICRARNVWKENMPPGTLAAVKRQMADSLIKEVPDELRLKVGAQVMLSRNKDIDRNLVNGSRGVVIRFEQGKDDVMIPVVRFDCGVTTSVTPVETLRYNPDGGIGCLARQQVPLKLAWAVTVHKSQGTTLSRALLDISSAFEFGQCYVALSRVQSLEGLWLVRPARLHNIKVSPQVFDFYYNRDVHP